MENKEDKNLVKIIYVYSDGSTVIHDITISKKDNFKSPFEKNIDNQKDINEIWPPKWNWPSTNPMPTNPIHPFPKLTYYNCPKCGMKVDQVLGYCCSQYDCPITPQVWCGV